MFTIRLHFQEIVEDEEEEKKFFFYSYRIMRGVVNENRILPLSWGITPWDSANRIFYSDIKLEAKCKMSKYD